MTSLDEVYRKTKSKPEQWPGLKPKQGLTPVWPLTRGLHHVPGLGWESLAVIGRCWRGLYLFVSSFCFSPSAASEENLEDSEKDHFTLKSNFKSKWCLRVSTWGRHSAEYLLSIFGTKGAKCWYFFNPTKILNNNFVKKVCQSNNSSR